MQAIKVYNLVPQTDQPENGYLKILYEGGIAGSIAVLLVIGDSIRRALTVIASNNADSDARTESIAALAGLVSLGVTFVTCFTMSDGRIMGILAFYSSVSGANGGIANATHLGGLLVAYLYLKSARMNPLGEVKYRYLRWKINRVRKKFDVYSGGRADDWDRRIH